MRYVNTFIWLAAVLSLSAACARAQTSEVLQINPGMESRESLSGAFDLSKLNTQQVAELLSTPTKSEWIKDILIAEGGAADTTVPTTLESLPVEEVTVSVLNGQVASSLGYSVFSVKGKGEGGVFILEWSKFATYRIDQSHLAFRYGVALRMVVNFVLAKGSIDAGTLGKLANAQGAGDFACASMYWQNIGFGSEEVTKAIPVEIAINSSTISNLRAIFAEVKDKVWSVASGTGHLPQPQILAIQKVSGL